MYTYALVLFSQTHTVFCTLHSYSTISVGRKGTRRSLHSDCHKSGPNGLEINVIKASNEPHQAAQPNPPPRALCETQRDVSVIKRVWLTGYQELPGFCIFCMHHVIQIPPPLWGEVKVEAFTVSFVLISPHSTDLMLHRILEAICYL